MARTQRYCWFDKYPFNSAALKNGTAAYGSQFIKPGFSFSEQLDLAWALGFPHMALLCDGHPDDEAPLQALRTYHYEGPVYPALTARCDLRDRFEFGAYAENGEAKWLPRIDEPLADEDTAGRFFKLSMPRDLFLFESLTSPEATVEAILDVVSARVEAGETERLASNPMRAIKRLPWLLMRTSEEYRRKALERIQALSEIELPKTTNRVFVVEAFDYVFDRAKKDEYHHQAYLHGRSPELLLQQARTTSLGPGGGIHARDAFIAGPEVIEILRGRLKSADKYKKQDMVDLYGWVKSEQTVLLFTELFSTRTVKESVQTWFELRADYARPILEDTEKAGDALGKKAKKVLKFLDRIKA